MHRPKAGLRSHLNAFHRTAPVDILRSCFSFSNVPVDFQLHVVLSNDDQTAVWQLRLKNLAI